MRWGMHNWFLAGMLASGIVVFLVVMLARSLQLSAWLLACYALMVVAFVGIRVRRRWGFGEMRRSRELRCRFPNDVRLRFRQARDKLRHHPAALSRAV